MSCSSVDRNKFFIYWFEIKPKLMVTWAYTTLEGVLDDLVNGGAYIPGGLISEGDYNRNNKIASKRAVTMLIEISCSFTGL